MTTGLISQLLSPQLSQTVSDLRDRISAVSLETVTGRHFDVTKHLNGRIGDAMIGQKALDDIEREQSQLQLRQSRLEQVQLSLETIQEAGGGIGVHIIGAVALGNTEEIEQGALDAETALGKVFSALSARHGQRQLFSGDATATGPLQPLDDLLSAIDDLRNTAVDAADFQASIDAYFDDPAGGWQTNMYNGTTTTSDPDGVLAVDPAITELVKGLATLAAARGNAENPIFASPSTVLNDGANTVVAATDRIIDLQVTTGSKQEQIVARQRVLVAETTIMSQSLSDLVSKDQFEAATELRRLESSLEASYLLTSRLSNLTLTNFIR